MKTILIAHNYSENSFAVMSFNLANYLAELGCKVVFISHKPFFKKTEITKVGKGEVIVLSWSSNKRPTSFRDVIHFTKIYFKYKPQVVIGHFGGSNISISVSKILSLGKTKTFAYYHTLVKQISLDQNEVTFRTKFLFLRKKMFYKLFCNLIICPSELAKKDLESFFRINKGRAILNPMTDRFTSKKNNSEDNIAISYLGRLDASKGVLDLIQAFEKFKKENLKSKIIINIAGTGSQQSEIERLLSVNSSIKYHGGLPYEKIDEYISNSNFIIIPSKFDALNMVGVESMMNQTPLLISNSTGLADYLIDGKECFKFNPDVDSIALLFEKIEKNIDKQEQMSIDARNTFLELFSMGKYCEEFSKMIL